MRASSLVLSAGVLQVKQVSGGGRHRIVVCTDTNVDWPDEASVSGLRDDLLARVPGIKLAHIRMPMAACQQHHILLVINLGAEASANKASWMRFETERVVYDNKRVLRIAEGSSVDKDGKRIKEPLVKRPPVRAFAAA